MKPRQYGQASPNGRLSVGTRITDDLEITSVLGEGGTGVVYGAYHRVLQREVAVKMSHVATLHAMDERLRLRREASLCASVKDRHVPRIYALDQLPDGTLYIVMEKMAGVSLAHLLSYNRLSIRSSCQIIMDVLLGLNAVHRAGVVHRDIKPSNIMVDLSGPMPATTLIDFGIGKVLKASETHLRLTRRGELVGTPYYMAPEQVVEGEVDARTDIYAVGVVLYEILCGSTPFRASSVAEVLVGLLRDEAPDLCARVSGLPQPLAHIAHRALKKNPEERFQSAREMLDALVAIESQLPHTAVKPRPTPQTSEGDSIEADETVLWKRPEKGLRRSLRCSRVRGIRTGSAQHYLPAIRAKRFLEQSHPAALDRPTTCSA